VNNIEEQVALRHWDRIAKVYTMLRFNPISYVILRKEQRSILNLLGRRTEIPDSGSALDLGMGSGLSLDLIPADISRIHALDQSAEMVARTRIKYKHVETITGSALNTPYESGCMDLILCIGVSEYIADIDVLISEIFRVLDDKGSAIITSSSPNILNHIRKISGHRLYLRSDVEMSESLSAGNFKILRINHTLIQDQFLLAK